MAKSKTNISQLNKYVKGRLNAQDMHQLERESYDDAFLNEALEGYEALPDDDHEETFALLKNQLHQRAAKSKQKPVVFWRVLPIAATVLVLLGAGYWFLKPEPIKTQNTHAALKNNKRQIAITGPGLQKVTTKERKLVADAHVEPERIKQPAPILNEVVIAGNPSVKYKADTVEYIASDYKVKSKASVDEILKKAEGFEVSPDGSLSFNGTEVSKARLNGKDYTGGDVAKAIKSLPADIIEKFQVVDNYGDQAGKTGIKSGEPDKVLNLTTAKNSVLNEVVVVGYGAQKKTALTGAVTTLKPAPLSIPPVTNRLNGAGNGISDKVLNPGTRPERNKSLGAPAGSYLNETVIYMPQIIYKTDTTEIITNNYPISNAAKVLNVIRRTPGFEQEDRNLYYEAKPIKKIKVNGKEYPGRDLIEVTRNLPADILEKVQVIDDYSNVANRGIRDPGPEKVVNLVVRDIKNRRLPWAIDGRGVIIPGDTVAKPKPQLGWKNYVDYIRLNAAASAKSSDEIMIFFYVGPDGTISNIQAVGYSSAAQYTKAISIIKNGPAWLGFTEPRQIWFKVKLPKK
ncbi:hypothetical protein ACFQZS_18220 [Mucilaginibacter calamicampi]|uniref:Uncharacterized protein n=1 Tax=Mucilaginibacter calamicampi TaxID=1302352 RepID=A0ABW2Z2Y9_9SPHI